MTFTTQAKVHENNKIIKTQYQTDKEIERESEKKKEYVQCQSRQTQAKANSACKVSVVHAIDAGSAGAMAHQDRAKNST